MFGPGMPRNDRSPVDLLLMDIYRPTSQHNGWSGLFIAMMALSFEAWLALTWSSQVTIVLQHFSAGALIVE